MTDLDNTNLLDLDREGLEAFFAERGEKSFRATQVMKWIYGQGVSNFEAMTNISKNLRADLQSCAGIRLPEVAADELSEDGSRKWLFRMADGNCIETVFIPETDRGTLCVSSQVGCVLNCSFCSTAQQGFNRNLSTGEIIAQVSAFAEDKNRDAQIGSDFSSIRKLSDLDLKSIAVNASERAIELIRSLIKIDPEYPDAQSLLEYSESGLKHVK